MPINHKQQAFINEYMINGHNATKAYKKAYPDCKSGHRQAASLLLTNIDITKAIEADMAVLKEETGWSVQIALDKLKDIIKKSVTGKQYSSAVSGIVAANRMFGLDKDMQLNAEQPLDLTAEQHEEALAASNRTLDIKLSQESA